MLFFFLLPYKVKQSIYAYKEKNYLKNQLSLNCIKTMINSLIYLTCTILQYYYFNDSCQFNLVLLFFTIEKYKHS